MDPTAPPPPRTALRPASTAWTILLAAVAGGMAWGIRGQYGHETGAMIFGVLVGFVLVDRLAPHLDATSAARAVALFAVGVGIGGSMTYGQTVGLSMDPSVHGSPTDPHWNAAAFRWGMLGLALKGAIWIGFGGLFLGMGLGGREYSRREAVAIGAMLLVVFGAGTWLLDTPFDPEARRLPFLYFSDHWRWEPADTVKPRPECQGGLLLALIGLAAYVGLVKRDGVAVWAGFWGAVGGLGFPIGQAIQVAARRDPAGFARSSWWQFGTNPWNTMEITFGSIAAACLALGLALGRRPPARAVPPRRPVPGLEWALMGIHAALLVAGASVDAPVLGLYEEYGLLLSLLPMAAVAEGSVAPFLVVFPVVAIPLVLKTRAAVLREGAFAATPLTAVSIVVVALLVALAAAFARRREPPRTARVLAGVGLPVMATLFFWLNFAVSGFPAGWFTDWPGMVGWRQSGACFVVGWLLLAAAGLARLRAPWPGPRTTPPSADGRVE